MSGWQVELNADVGEGSPFDDEILTLVQRANVCLGAHAGSADLTRQTVEECRRRSIAFCAHPGYPDPTYFGRRLLPATGLTKQELADSLADQVGPWKGEFVSLKPHGGFYHDSQEPGDAFDLLVDLLKFNQVPLLGMPSTAHVEAAQKAGVALISEGFADRGYAPNGRLLPRNQPGAFVGSDRLDAHLEGLVGTVRSLCVHGDGDEPVDRLRAVRAWLDAHGHEVCAWTS